MAISSSLFDLTGQSALVTGGASGIGLAVALALQAHGAKVAVGSRTREKVQDAVNQLHDQGDGSAIGVALDVTDQAGVDAAVAQTVEAFGSLSIVVNSAGVMHKVPTIELDPADFDRLHQTHVTGSLRVSQAAYSHLKASGGCIINIASVSSFVDLVGVAAYASAKNAILGLTRSLANEWAKDGVRTNAIAPGFIPTDINRKMIEGTDRGRRIMEHTPMGRFGTGDEIAGGAVYLASPAASFVNGHTLVIDGGYLACGIGDSVAPWDRQNG